MKQDPEEAIALRERRTRSLLLEYSQLTSQRGVLDHEMHRSVEGGDERAEQREEGANHARRLVRPDDSGKAEFISDSGMFGVMATYRGILQNRVVERRVSEITRTSLALVRVTAGST